MLTSSATRRRPGWAWRTCLDWFYPRTCVHCGRHLADQRGGFTCALCRSRIRWIRDPRCRSCGVPIYGAVGPEPLCGACRKEPPAFTSCRSLFLYRETGARLVHALKYEHAVWLQAELTALFREAAGWAEWFGEGCLVPIPLHPAKQRSRGYNQAEIIAAAICAAFPDTRLHPCLERIRRTPSQTFLSRQQRRRNMRSAFACKQPLPGGRIVLVDDVLTTGATLNAAVMALHEAGPGNISAFTLAHG